MKKKSRAQIARSEKTQMIKKVLEYFKTEGVVVEPHKGYYRLKTQKEIKKELAEICK
jgi:hypothetical protein